MTLIMVTHIMEWLNLMVTLPYFFDATLRLFFLHRISRGVVAHRMPEQGYEGRVAILIPCYNEEQNIRLCLQALLRSSYSLDKLVVYLIDDASTDRTLSIANEVFSEFPAGTYKIFNQNHGGKAAGLQVALDAVQEEVCILLDADTFLTEDCIPELLKGLDNPDVACVSSMILIWKPVKWIEFFQSVEYCLTGLIQKAIFCNLGSAYYIAGQAMSVRTEALRAIGGIPQNLLTEDFEIYMRLLLQKKKILWNQQAVAYTRACDSFGELFFQRMRWWYGGASCLVSNMMHALRNDMLAGLPARRVFLLLSLDRLAALLPSLFMIPCVAYFVVHWFPPNATYYEAFEYLFFWFSAFGPTRVLLNIVNWGINWFSIFGVLCGFFYGFINILALRTFRHTTSWKYFACFCFLFPYFLCILPVVPISILYYRRRDKRRFID